MSYTPTNWQTGDIVSSQRLNKMEGGIANAEQLFMITATSGAGSVTADKTAMDVYDALKSGKVPVIKVVMNGSVIGMLYYAGTFEVSDGTRPVFMTCTITGTSSNLTACSLDNNGDVSRISTDG